ncbi:MAG: hypothetical protein ACP5M0_13495 [Desulfomonilaceae bacterium]
MIKTLVSVEVDLVSSLALRFACQLSAIVPMDIQPVYIKESSPYQAMGAGWASRTWEKELVEQARAEVSDVVNVERDFCPVVKDPVVIYGDKDAELVKLVESNAYDLYVRGVKHVPWTAADLHKKFHAKLYQKIVPPVILVRTLRKINQVEVLCLEPAGTNKIVDALKRLWTECPVPLVLTYPGTSVASGGAAELQTAVEQGKAALAEAGCSVSINDTLPTTPPDEASDYFQDHGVVAVALPRNPKKDSIELQWISHVRTSVLMALY